MKENNIMSFMSPATKYGCQILTIAEKPFMITKKTQINKNP